LTGLSGRTDKKTMTKLAQIHTSEHIFWQVLKNKYPGLKTAGLELNEEKTRIDYKCDQDLTKVDLEKLEAEVNEIIAKGLPVVFETLPRGEAAKQADLSLVPENVKEIRLVKIGNFSCEACIGEHVSNTSQIGRFKILEMKKIGKDSYRFVVTVEEETESKRKTISAKAKIIPQTLKGFRDFLPEEAKKRQWLKEQMIKVFEKWGYEPLETPTLEPLDIFKGQIGEDEKLFFRFKDLGGRDVIMRYDQTVPSCRVIGQYFDKFVFPFRRYQIQSNFRAEKPQRGRFREFTQADIDIFGNKSPLADAECIAASLDLYKNLGFKNPLAVINNRDLLKDIPYPALVAIDKLGKIGENGVLEDMDKKGIPKDKARKYFEIVKNLKPDEKLEIIFDFLKKSGFPESWYQFEPTLSRSFSYSEGPIWEIKIPGYEAGSVGGGERYDKMLAFISGKDIGATGIAFGFDRTLEATEQFGLVPKIKTVTKALVTIFSPEFLEKSIEVATLLRYRNGVNTELYPDPEAKLDKQLKYADKKGIPYVIILGPKEVETKTVVVKNMRAGEQKKVPLADLNRLKTDETG
jgi:histidyl-tRNA synthetase